MGTIIDDISKCKIWWCIALIVLMVGTGPDSFDRLVRPFDELVKRHGWKVFVQLGHTRYVPRHCQYERFIERDALLQKIKTAELVVTQGGYGGIRDALAFNKKILAVPRYPDLNESPDRQEEMVRVMEEKGYLIGVYNIDDLEKKIHQAKEFQPKPRGKSRIPEFIRSYINQKLMP